MTEERLFLFQKEKIPWKIKKSKYSDYVQHLFLLKPSCPCSALSSAAPSPARRGSQRRVLSEWRVHRRLRLVLMSRSNNHLKSRRSRQRRQSQQISSAVHQVCSHPLIPIYLWLTSALVELRHRTVRIYKPTRNTMQSGGNKGEKWRIDFDILQGGGRWENPQMGWASS